MLKSNELPEYMMFLFDGEDDDSTTQDDSTTEDDKTTTEDDKTTTEDKSTTKDKTSDGGQKTDTDKTDKKVVIPSQKTGETDAQYGKRIRELEDANRAKNAENATRRRENNDLKVQVETVNRRLIVADVKTALAEAGSISKRAAELFLSDHADDVQIDPKTGNTTGLDKVAEWKKANPEFFKANDDKKDDKKDEKDDKKDKKGNSSAKGGSQGAGAGLDNDSKDGMPDLSTLKNPKEREAAVRSYMQSLKGSGSGYGYGKASSKT